MKHIISKCFAVLLFMCFIGIFSQNASSCFYIGIRYLPSGLQWTFGDGGATDVGYYTADFPEKNVTPGSEADYTFQWHYSPGCGSEYDAKWIILNHNLPAGWSSNIRDDTGDIYGKQMKKTNSAYEWIYFSVETLSSAKPGDFADVTARLWMNDTAACNQHSTVDINTHTVIPGGPPKPLTISVISPNGGEIWKDGTAQNITWTATGGNGTLSINLDYSVTGSNGTWIAVASGLSNSGKYSWTVPNIPSTDCYVKATVTDRAAPPNSVYDISDANFTITNKTPPPPPPPTKPSITINAPNGGEMLDSGSMYEITWTASGGSGALSINLEYSIAGSGGPWTIISAGETNDGTFSWIVPNTPSTNCYVKGIVADSASPPQTATDASDAKFTIQDLPKPTIKLSSPAGSEVWNIGSVYDITWTASGGTGVLKIMLEYSPTGIGDPYKIIDKNISNSGSYKWTVPNDPSTDCYIIVQVTDSASPPKQVFDRNPLAFTIQDSSGPPPPGIPSITVTSPNGGENLKVGSVHDINWDAGGGTGALAIKLEYSVAGASGPWTVISGNEVNDGAYSWNIPNNPSANCYVKATVTDSTTPRQTAYDSSNAAFIISNDTGTTTKDGTVIGTVKDNGGNSLKDATITVIKGTAIQTTVKTGTDGKYTVTLSPGDYEINATKTGYQPSLNMMVNLASGDIVTQDFILQTISNGGDGGGGEDGSGGNPGVGKNSPTPTIAGIPQPMFYGITVVLTILIVVIAIALTIAMRKKKRKQVQESQKWTYYQSPGQVRYYPSSYNGIFQIPSQNAGQNGQLTHPPPAAPPYN